MSRWHHAFVTAAVLVAAAGPARAERSSAEVAGFRGKARSALQPSSTPAAAEPARLARARERVLGRVRALFEEAKAAYPPRPLLLRAFKQEGLLELWAEPSAGARYVKIKAWPICARSGAPGPKRRAGDEQVPEGFYRISQLNPWSNFHLSLRVDYPNRADRILGSKADPGGDIFIHGGCVTIGCLPLGDAAIEELYVIAADALKAGSRLDVHLFPARLDEAGVKALAPLARGDSKVIGLWMQLREGFDRFEQTGRPAAFRVDNEGRYVFTESAGRQ